MKLQRRTACGERIAARYALRADGYLAGARLSRAGADATLTPMGSGNAFLQIADNAMNYHILGERGFEAVGRMVDNCQSFGFEYSRLDDAIAVFDRLAAEAESAAR